MFPGKPQIVPPSAEGEPRRSAKQPREELVQRELEKILLSTPFRSSKRSQQFLRYVVEQALQGHPENLKERSIGIDVFARRPSYDTSEDATVRVTANEVRKRLAQYYLETAAPGEVRIDLPPGSYVPEFHWQEAPAVTIPKPAEAAPGRLRRRITVGLALVAVAVAAVFLGLRLVPAPSAFDQFWAPVLQSQRPLLVCLAHPVVYLLSERVHKEFLRSHPLDRLAGPYVVELDPKQIVGGDVIPVPDQYVGAGDAYASSQLLGLFSKLNKPTQLRIGDDISFADLRNSPAVLIGAYSNRWTMQANVEYRFAFDELRVFDRLTVGREWKLTDVSPDFKSAEDYAIVSRVFNSHTGQLVITAAGITQYGTQSAGEFLTNPAHLSAALRDAPEGWQKQNLQIVLHTKITGRTPGPPKVVAAHFW